MTERAAYSLASNVRPERHKKTAPPSPSVHPSYTRGETASQLTLAGACVLSTRVPPLERPAMPSKRIWARLSGIVGPPQKMPYPTLSHSLSQACLPWLRACKLSHSCPTCHPGLMPVRASPPPHLAPHLSPAGYGAARARNLRIQHAGSGRYRTRGFEFIYLFCSTRPNQIKNKSRTTQCTGRKPSPPLRSVS